MFCCFKEKKANKRLNRVITGSLLLFFVLLLYSGKVFAKTDEYVFEQETKWMEREEYPDVLLDQEQLEYKYVDSIYSDFVSGGKRKRNLIEDQSSYLVKTNRGWIISGQAWKESVTGNGKYEYANTTGFLFRLPDQEYKIEMVFWNPKNDDYKITIWDERGRQTKKTVIPSGKETKVTFRASVLNQNIKLFVIPETKASDEKKGKITVYVKSIALTTVKNREKGTKPVLHLMGDSTMHSVNSNVYPREGWGQEFYHCFEKGQGKSGKQIWTDNRLNYGVEYQTKSFVIRNWAYSGGSTESFWQQGRFDNILSFIRQGDYVIIQFGHNDAKKNIPGYSASISEYKKNLELLVRACQERGATCLLLSPGPRCRFKNNKIISAVSEYKAAEKVIAQKTKAIFVDTGSAVEQYMTTLGKEKALSYYMVLKPGEYKNYPKGYKDSNHFNYKGAKKAAQIVAVTLRESRQVPYELRRAITSPADYYNGVVLNIKNIKVQKEKKNTGKTKITWKQQKHVKQYTILQYNAKNNTYKKIGTTKQTSYTLKGQWTKKQISKLKVQAILGR